MDLTRSLENVGNGSFENVHLNNEKTQQGFFFPLVDLIWNYYSSQNGHVFQEFVEKLLIGLLIHNQIWILCNIWKYMELNYKYIMYINALHDFLKILFIQDYVFIFKKIIDFGNINRVNFFYKKFLVISSSKRVLN